jgi:hypothetical protein
MEELPLQDDRTRQITTAIASICLASVAMSKVEGKSGKEAFDYAKHSMGAFCNYAHILPNESLQAVMQAALTSSMYTQYGQKPLFAKEETKGKEAN